MLPEFIIKRVQRELDAAKNPKGMSLHAGKVTLQICDVERMLISVAPTPPEVEPVGFVNHRVIQELRGGKPGMHVIGERKSILYSEPIYTSPPTADAELRKAAEDLVNYFTNTELPPTCAAWVKVFNLRAALNKGKSC